MRIRQIDTKNATTKSPFDVSSSSYLRDSRNKRRRVTQKALKIRQRSRLSTLSIVSFRFPTLPHRFAVRSLLSHTNGIAEGRYVLSTQFNTDIPPFRFAYAISIYFLYLYQYNSIETHTFERYGAINYTEAFFFFTKRCSFLHTRFRMLSSFFTYTMYTISNCFL